MEAPAVPVANPHHSMDILDEIFGSEWSATGQQQQQTASIDCSNGRTELMRRKGTGGVEAVVTAPPALQPIQPHHPPTCLTPGPTLSQHSGAETCFSPAGSQETGSVVDDNEAAISERSVAADFAADTTTPPPRRNSNNSIRGTLTAGIHPSIHPSTDALRLILVDFFRV